MKNLPPEQSRIQQQWRAARIIDCLLQRAIVMKDGRRFELKEMTNAKLGLSHRVYMISENGGPAMPVHFYTLEEYDSVAGKKPRIRFEDIDWLATDAL